MDSACVGANNLGPRAAECRRVVAPISPTRDFGNRGMVTCTRPTRYLDRVVWSVASGSFAPLQGRIGMFGRSAHAAGSHA